MLVRARRRSKEISKPLLWILISSKVTDLTQELQGCHAGLKHSISVVCLDATIVNAMSSDTHAEVSWTFCTHIGRDIVSITRAERHP